MTHNFIRIYFRIAIIFTTLLLPRFLICQTIHGRVLSSKTDSAISYVNIGIVGKNIGTVSDESGKFILKFERIDKDDSLRFSMVGYKSRTVQLSSFRDDTSKTVFLDPVLYNLN
jgi:hypothetical protein